MILSDREIGAALENNFIRIHPRPAEKLWTSTAIDLTLHKVLVEWRPTPPSSGQPTAEVCPAQKNFNVKKLMEDPAWAQKITIPATGFVLEPGQFVLGFTAEIVQFPHRFRVAARVEGKSSLARLGVGVHVTAPTIHSGFGVDKDKPAEAGSNIQLEIFNLGKLRVKLEAGMAICQLILEEVREVPQAGYSGQFAGQQVFTTGKKNGSPKTRKQ